MIRIPKNGHYLSRDDFGQWQDEFSKAYTSYQKCTGCDSNCLIEDESSCSAGSDLKVKNITFVVTERCNLNCTYCYEQHKTGKIMTKEVAKEAVDFLFDQKRVNGYFDPITSPGCILEFIGGEPLLEIELMDYIVEYFKRKAFEIDSPWATNYMISMTSNGTLFQTPKVQEFLQKNLGKVSIGITIDGNKRLHDACRLFHDGKGSYDIVEASVKQAIKDGYMDSTKITLSHENIMYLNEAMQNIWSLGLSGSHTNCVFEDVWDVEDAKILYNQMKELGDYLLKDKNYTRYYCSLFDDYIGSKLVDDKNFCGGNGEMLAIGTDGKCYPCIRFMQYSLNNQQEKCIGNIYDGLDNKDENEWLKELKAITMTSQCQYEDNKKCLDCTIATGCALCTGYNYDTFGTPNHKATFICDMHKARVLANCYYWNKLKKEVPIVKDFKLNLNKEECLKIIDENEYNLLLSLIEDN